MSIIQLKEMTPQIYTEESRDFQLLTRLYDSVLNGLKFDTDSILSLIDTKGCRTSILQLLQTKLGFFTERKLDDEKLRSILECFPILVRNKGSLRAIKESIYLFLRMYSVSSDLEIYYLKTPYSPPFSKGIPCVLSTGKLPENNSLIIQIHSFQTKPDIAVLEEIFRYILPAGINYYIEFDQKRKLSDIVLKNDDTAEFVFVSDNINSGVRGSDQKFGSTGDRILVVTDEYSTPYTPFGISYENPETILSENPNTTYSTEVITITEGTDTGIDAYVIDEDSGSLAYKLGAANTMALITTTSYVSNRFIGYYDSQEEADDYLSTLDNKLYSTAIITYTSGDTVETKPMICVAYSSSTPTWYQINFLGSLTSEEVSTEGGIVSALASKGIEVSNGDLILYNNVYLLRVSDSWQECNYARYILNTYSTTE